MFKFLVPLFFSFSAEASTVAVIDSGLDVDNQAFKDSLWRNPEDSTFDRVDQDKNDKIDDVFGWNFIDNNNFLIDITQAELLTPEIVEFFDLQSKLLEGTAVDAEKDWLKKKMKDQDFIQRLTAFGAFAHGTHVSGIVAAQSPSVKVLTVKLIPSSNPLKGLKKDITKALAEGKEPNQIVKYLIKGGLVAFARLQASVFTPIGKYLNEKKVDVANGSFGFSLPQARGLVKTVLQLVTPKDQEPSTELVNEFAVFLLKEVVAAQETLVRSAPDTLFVFAAGNDGLSNDEYPVAPASIKHPHTLSVAALNHDGTLAIFSNYGDSVDLAVVGVGVESFTPRGPKIKMSGTSQAAPQVAGIAAAVKAVNDKLSASELKQLLLSTSDYRPELKGKVLGVVNSKRALLAAKYSLEYPLKTATEKSIQEVSDQQFPTTFTQQPDLDGWFNFMPNYLL